MKTYAQIAQEVHTQWLAEGKVHLPPDDVSQDDDLGFWFEVDRRFNGQREGE